MFDLVDLVQNVLYICIYSNTWSSSVVFGFEITVRGVHLIIIIVIIILIKFTDFSVNLIDISINLTDNLLNLIDISV